MGRGKKEKSDKKNTAFPVSGKNCVKKGEEKKARERQSFFHCPVICLIAAYGAGKKRREKDLIERDPQTY
jgi:hypothetical protein